MSTANNSPGWRARVHQAVSAKASIAFPLKIADNARWRNLRKHLLADIPVGWKARRACPYTDGSGALTFSCMDARLFGNLTPEWIDLMTAKVQLVTEA